MPLSLLLVQESHAVCGKSSVALELEPRTLGVTLDVIRLSFGFAIRFLQLEDDFVFLEKSSLHSLTDSSAIPTLSIQQSSLNSTPPKPE